jgi:hypothetical protein
MEMYKIQKEKKEINEEEEFKKNFETEILKRMIIKFGCLLVTGFG